MRIAYIQPQFQSLRYIGQVKSISELHLLKDAKTGDVRTVDEHSFVYDGKNWQQLDSDDKSNDTPKITARLCSQCGAPVKLSRLTCEYCGVKY